MDFDEKHKDIVGERLTRKLARAIENGDMNQEQASEASAYILDTIDTLEDHAQLISFLTTISQKWPVFSSVLDLEQGEVSQAKEEQKVEEVENLLKENKIDEALHVAESATAPVGTAQAPQEPPPMEPPQVTQFPQAQPVTESQISQTMQQTAETQAVPQTQQGEAPQTTEALPSVTQQPQGEQNGSTTTT